MKVVFCTFAVLLATPADAALRQAPGPAAAAAAAAPGGAAATMLTGLSVSFELANYNYNDLEKECGTAPVAEQPAAGAPVQPESPHKDFSGHFWHGVKEHAKAMSRTTAQRIERVARAAKHTVVSNAKRLHGVLNSTAHVAHNANVATNDAAHDITVGTAHATHGGVESVTGSVVDANLPASNPHPPVQEHPRMDVGSAEKIVIPKNPAFLGVARRGRPLTVPSNHAKDACVKRVLVGAIVDAFQHRALHAAIGAAEAEPAAAAPSAAFLHAAPATNATRNPKWGRVEIAPVVDVHVDLQPGPARPLNVAGQKGWGRTILVNVVVTDKAGSGGDELTNLASSFEDDKLTQAFWAAFAFELNGVTGIAPKIDAVKVAPIQIAQWDVANCSQHMKTVVRRFELAYTRDQVPMALYNECTNFMAKLSFSHDVMPTALDQKRCRRVTARFGNKFAATESHDFNQFCLDVCEVKYGTAAPQCHVTEGKKRASLKP